MAFFSVIIPTYNREAVLARAIESVLSQSFQNFELIVVDDGSTDGTTELLKQYPRINYIKTTNQGVSAARNRGISMATGEWICFLDSDDEWLPKKLQLQADYILSYPNIKLIHGEEIWIRNGMRVNPKKKHQKSGGDQFFAGLKLCIISPSTVCLHRELLNEFGGFNCDYTVCEDYELWLRITAKYPIGFIETPIIKKYGGHEDQLSRKYVAMDYFRVRAMVELANTYKLKADQLKALKQEVLFKSEILLKGHVKHGQLEHLKKVTHWHAWATN